MRFGIGIPDLGLGFGIRDLGLRLGIKITIIEFVD